MRLPSECSDGLNRPQLTGRRCGSAGPSSPAALPERRGALSPATQPAPAPQGLYDGGDRATPCQTELDVTLWRHWRWVLCWWRSGGLALAIDPTLKGDQTTAIGVVYRSCAIPVAWQSGTPTSPAPAPPWNCCKPWPQRFPSMTVIVLCDRRHASPKLWQYGIKASRYAHRKNITFCGRQTIARPIRRGLAAAPPSDPQGPTPLAGAGTPTPWIILTDLAPDQVGPSWYALRFWIELGFKALRQRRCCADRWPWPMAPGWRTPGAEDCSRQPAGGSAGLASQRGRSWGEVPRLVRGRRRTPRPRHTGAR